MDLIRARLLPERWPVAAAMGIGTFVLLVGLWTVSPGLTIAFGVAFVFAAACLSFVNRSEGDHGGLNPGRLERFRRSELALATATDVDTAARELCKQVVTRLDAPAAVVIVEGVGETVRIEAGDTQAHSIHGEGSYSRALAGRGAARWVRSPVAPRPNRPYDDRDERALDDVVDRAVVDLAPPRAVRRAPPAAGGHR